MKIAIIDYGMGNTFSIMNTLSRLNIETVVTDDIDHIKKAAAIVLPGVGAFGEAIENLKTKKLDQFLIDQILEGKPFLGICLGMQLLAKESCEGGVHRGLGIIDTLVVPLKSQSLKIPHVGWNNVEQTVSSVLFKEIGQNSHFYFDHSFCLDERNDYVIATSEYGCSVPAAFEYHHVFGVQFHPEKSQNNGLKLLSNFVEMAKCYHA